MKIYVFFFVTCVFLYIEAVPIHRTKGLTRHERELLRELLCILKVKSGDECIRDNSINSLMQRPLGSGPQKDSSNEESLSHVDRSSMALPPGAASKRDAFYSDWKRRR